MGTGTNTPDRQHALVGSGAPHNRDGYRLPEAWSHTSGGGHAACSCGSLSPDLPSRSARRRWHREHKVSESVTTPMGGDGFHDDDDDDF